jgi:HEPN domain-containing protein
MVLPIAHDNDDFSKTLFQNIINLYIAPEIERRKEQGKISENFVLVKAQVIFNPDKKENTVRINDEVLTNAYIKLKNGISKEKGDPIFENEVEDIGVMYPAKEEDQDLGHITIVKIKDYYHMSFDFRYNKRLSSKYIKNAKEFLENAEYDLTTAKWAPFIDNLFSASELAIKSILLTIPDPKFKKKSSHKEIEQKYSIFHKSLRLDPGYQECFTTLSRLRSRARYSDPDFKIAKEDAEKYLEIVKKIITEAEQRIAIRK